AVAALGTHDDGLPLVVLDGAAAVRTREDLEQLLVDRHQRSPSPPMSASTRSVPSRRRSSLFASTFNRSNGSVFEGRRLNHQSSNSTVRPSVRSCRPVANSAATQSVAAPWSSTFVLISPEST